MADGDIPSGFQKGGNVSRSPMKNISNRALELNRLRQVMEVFPYEPMSLLNDTQRQFIREMAVHLGLEGEKLIQDVANYIDGICSKRKSLPQQKRYLVWFPKSLRNLRTTLRQSDRETLQEPGTVCPSLLPVPARKPQSCSRRVEQQKKMLTLPQWS
jgi:hypothetical protein